MNAYTVIEYPASGATYSHQEYGVYRYDTYPRGSVLEGQERRTFLDRYDTLEEARKDYPKAQYNGGGSGYREIVIPDAPPAWFDPADAGESWDGE